MNEENKVIYFGETDFRNGRTKFGIKKKDRTRHMYIIGKTGMGKSTLLENLAIQDIQNGEGICFIDPHGSAAEKLLEYVPKERVNDVIYFAPFDLANPISFNVLEGIDEERKHLIAAGLMNAFKKIWADAFSGRMEYILGMTLLALLDNPGETLLGVNRMYADKDYRKRIVDNIKDPSVRAFWVEEYAKYSEKFATEATAAIQNKIGQFTANPLIRNLLGQQESSFDFRQAMDQKKILIVNLSKGKMGPDNMRLIGGMVVTKIYLAAMSRADASAKELKELAPFYLYVDEFQNFANESFAEILSESRKYNLALTVANQYIEQMTEEVRGAILGNVGSMITFRIGAPDAEIMEKEFTPYFTAEDLVNLGFAQVYLKLMIDGIGSQPFSCTTMAPIPELETTYANEIISHSRLSYCKPRDVVEENIKNWFVPSKPAQVAESRSAPVEYKKYREGTFEKRPSQGSDQKTEYISKPRFENKQVQVVNNLNNTHRPKTEHSAINRDENVQRDAERKTVYTQTSKVEPSNSPVKDLLDRIKKGEIVEDVDRKNKSDTLSKSLHTNSEHNRDSKYNKAKIESKAAALPISAIAKDKSPYSSQNKSSLKDAIEAAIKDSAKNTSSVTDRPDDTIKKVTVNNTVDNNTKQQNNKEEVSEDILKKLLEI